MMNIIKKILIILLINITTSNVIIAYAQAIKEAGAGLNHAAIAIDGIRPELAKIADKIPPDLSLAEVKKIAAELHIALEATSKNLLATIETATLTGKQTEILAVTISKELQTAVEVTTKHLDASINNLSSKTNITAEELRKIAIELRIALETTSKNLLATIEATTVVGKQAETLAVTIRKELQATIEIATKHIDASIHNLAHQTNTTALHVTTTLDGSVKRAMESLERLTDSLLTKTTAATNTLTKDINACVTHAATTINHTIIPLHNTLRTVPTTMQSFAFIGIGVSTSLVGLLLIKKILDSMVDDEKTDDKEKSAKAYQKKVRLIATGSGFLVSGLLTIMMSSRCANLFSTPTH